MWDKIKIWLADLGDFLFRFTQSTGAKFIKEYGPMALTIVMQVAAMPLSNQDKFKKAGELLKAEVPGVAQWMIDTAIQVAYAMYQEEQLKKDTDTDGVPDYKDLCKDVGAPPGGCGVDANGCPVACK